MLPSEITTSTPESVVLSFINSSVEKDWPEGSQRWSNVQQAYMRAMKAAIEKQLLPPVNINQKEGFGIVMCVSPAYERMAYVTVKAIRKTGCQLPIEIFYSSESGESPEPFVRSLFEGNGVRYTDADKNEETMPCPTRNGWPLKPFAIRNSQFEHVLYLDADCYPIQNPEPLFDDRRYELFNCIYWPDDKLHDLEDSTWKAMGMAPQKCWSFESGQILMNTKKHWRELALTNWINQNSEFYYRLFWGDKDSFCVAWRKLETRYVLVPHRWCQVKPAIVQYDFDNNPLFVHRVGHKFSDAEFKTPQTDKYNQNLPLELDVHLWAKEFDKLTDRTCR